MIRVLLVDDQELVRAGLRRILAARHGFEVVGECADGDEVEAAVDSLHPDLVLMDMRMKRMDGAEATRRVRSAEGRHPVLVLTTFDDDEVLSAALRAGASGFLLKDSPGEELIRAATRVAAGDAWLDPAVTGRVLSAYRQGTSSPPPIAPRQLDDLTPREREVLKLIGRGHSNLEIAEELVVSEATVKTHVGNIFMKLGVRDRAAAIVFAFDHRVVQPDA